MQEFRDCPGHSGTLGNYASVSEPVSRKAKYSDRALGHAPALPGILSHLSKERPVALSDCYASSLFGECLAANFFVNDLCYLHLGWHDRALYCIKHS